MVRSIGAARGAVVVADGAENVQATTAAGTARHAGVGADGRQ